MASEKPLVDFHSLHPGVIYTIEKIEFLDTCMELELENVKIEVPTVEKKKNMYFLVYDGKSVNFVLPTYVHCFCPRECDVCRCESLQRFLYCPCTEPRVADVVKFEIKINRILENNYEWCWFCQKYIWQMTSECPHY